MESHWKSNSIIRLTRSLFDQFYKKKSLAEISRIELLFEQRKYKKVQRIGLPLIDAWERALGNHSSAIRGIYTLAQAVSQNGNYAKAEELLEQVAFKLDGRLYQEDIIIVLRDYMSAQKQIDEKK